MANYRIKFYYVISAIHSTSVIVSLAFYQHKQWSTPCSDVCQTDETEEYFGIE